MSSLVPDHQHAMLEVLAEQKDMQVLYLKSSDSIGLDDLFSKLDSIRSNNPEILLHLTLFSHETGLPLSLVIDKLKQGASIQSLALYTPDLGKHIDPLMEALKDNERLKCLNLFWHGPPNPIPDGFVPVENSHVAAVAEMLKKNSTLWSLNLGNWDIKRTGFQQKAEALKVNRKLENLDLSDNVLAGRDLDALLEGMEGNESIERVYIQNKFKELTRQHKEQLRQSEIINVIPEYSSIGGRNDPEKQIIPGVMHTLRKSRSAVQSVAEPQKMKLTS